MRSGNNCTFALDSRPWRSNMPLLQNHQAEPKQNLYTIANAVVLMSMRIEEE